MSLPRQVVSVAEGPIACFFVLAAQSFLPFVDRCSSQQAPPSRQPSRSLAFTFRLVSPSFDSSNSSLFHLFSFTFWRLSSWSHRLPTAVHRRGALPAGARRAPDENISPFWRLLGSRSASGQKVEPRQKGRVRRLLNSNARRRSSSSPSARFFLFFLLGLFVFFLFFRIFSAGETALRRARSLPAFLEIETGFR